MSLQEFRYRTISALRRLYVAEVVGHGKGQFLCRGLLENEKLGRRSCDGRGGLRRNGLRHSSRNGEFNRRLLCTSRHAPIVKLAHGLGSLTWTPDPKASSVVNCSVK